MKTPVLAGCTLILALFSVPLRGTDSPPSSPLQGAWRLDATRSTGPSAWNSLNLTITVVGDIVTIRRQFTAGRQQHEETMIIDTSRPMTVVPIAWWPDNRYIDASLGGDKTKQVHATWLDDRHILRLSSDLVLDAQQGPHAVNILDDYKVSASGRELTLTELRSTRNRPIVYVFKRVAP